MEAAHRTARSATNVVSTLRETPGRSLHKLVPIAVIGYAQQAKFKI